MQFLWSVIFLILKMEAIHPHKASVNFYRTSSHNITQDSNLDRKFITAVGTCDFHTFGQCLEEFCVIMSHSVVAV
jgi:hypothetical protein